MTHFRVDGVVCLVDSMFLKDHINEVRPEGTVNEAVQQVAFADKILLNKTDLVSKVRDEDSNPRPADAITRLLTHTHPPTYLLAHLLAYLLT